MIIETINLTKRYGDLMALNNLHLNIEEGECLGYIGPNGAGKTTTIKILATLLQPTWGEARICGHVVGYQSRKIRPLIGYVPDSFGAYSDMVVQEYLEFFASAYGITGEQRTRIVGDVLDLTDLSFKREALVDSLSRGMKQRLSIARVLLHDPKVLLLDEPASGLDPRARIEMRELLKELKNMGKTILVSSHILHELSQICTRIGIIEAGKFVAEGSLQDIYRQLSLKRQIHIQFANLDDAMLAAIRAIPGVVAAEPLIDRLSLQVQEEILPPEELLDRLHALGARIRMFQPEAMDMETVFMKLTEGKTA